MKLKLCWIKRSIWKHPDEKYNFWNSNFGLPGLFIIDAINGVVRIAGDLSSDYQPFYELRVEAYDGGSPSRSSIATVRISVIDQNTQRPMFRQTLYQLQVLEGQSVGHGDISCVPLLAKALATR